MTIFRQKISLIGLCNPDVVLTLIQSFIYELYLESCDSTSYLAKLCNLVRYNMSMMVLSNADTILHALIKKTPNIKGGNKLSSFLRFLIKCGTNKNAQNSEKYPPLYLALVCNISIETIEGFLDAGCHIDQCRKYPLPTPYVYLLHKHPNIIKKKKISISLECLAATVILKNKISCLGSIHKHLKTFVEIHKMDNIIDMGDNLKLQHQQ